MIILNSHYIEIISAWLGIEKRAPIGRDNVFNVYTDEQVPTNWIDSEGYSQAEHGIVRNRYGKWSDLVRSRTTNVLCWTYAK